MRDGELRRLASGTFMVGFPGTQPTRELEELIAGGVAGCILFSRNIASPEETATLNRTLKGLAGRPFLLAVDQEGGRVARLRGAPYTPLAPMRALGALGDEALAEGVGRLLAAELRAVGFDWDFAPVLDVDTNPKNPVIGDRAFSSDPTTVARMGTALARGLEGGGVASCGKHFPGHGDTLQDSHLDLPRLPHELARLRRVELVPFAAWAKAGLASLMTAHVVFDAVEPELPATMSGKVLSTLLRGELGFSGLVVSDDLEMKAIAGTVGVERAAVEALAAGVDLFLVCHTPSVQRRAIDAVVAAVREGRVPAARLEEAAARVAALTERFARPSTAADGAWLGSPEHVALAAQVREAIAPHALASGPAPVDPTEATGSVLPM